MKTKNSFRLKFLLFAILMACQVSLAFSQGSYTLIPNQELKVSGGSTLHDWHMVTHAAKGEGEFLIENGQFKGAAGLQVNFPTESLKSGTKGLDANAYKSLKSDQYKEITFVLTELKGSGGDFTAKGTLAIAGVTKPVTFPLKVTASGNQVSFEGSLDTTLTYFSIKPPTALLGTVKTDDEVTLSFKTAFKPSF